jgi:hypothetical protein
VVLELHQDHLLALANKNYDFQDNCFRGLVTMSSMREADFSVYAGEDADGNGNVGETRNSLYQRAVTAQGFTVFRCSNVNPALKKLSVPIHARIL